MARKKRTSTSGGSRSHRERYVSPDVNRLEQLPVLTPGELVTKTVRQELKNQTERVKRSFRPDLSIVEDLRRVPEAYRRIRSFLSRDGRVARTENRPSRKVQEPWLHAPLHTYFRDPLRAIVCIRRAIRKRVLFALRKAGKGKRVSSMRRFTDKSYIRCK